MDQVRSSENPSEIASSPSQYESTIFCKSHIRDRKSILLKDVNRSTFLPCSSPTIHQSTTKGKLCPDSQYVCAIPKAPVGPHRLGWRRSSAPPHSQPQLLTVLSTNLPAAKIQQRFPSPFKRYHFHNQIDTQGSD